MKLFERLKQFLVGKKALDAASQKELETVLLSSDVGPETTQYILSRVNPENPEDSLKKILVQILEPCAKPLPIPTKPMVILVVGVNGSGKTTTIGKLAHYFQKQDKKVILAAGDTFRAAAIEQLQTWGNRNQTTVIAQAHGADSAAVIFDACQAAKARDFDILLADTAGRLHTQLHLMDELKKIKRVLAKVDASAPHETLLVLDSTIGQNALKQIEEFNQAIGLTGLIVTKLDGTAKGGVLFTIAHRYQLPVRFIGVGEGIEDLKPFNAEEFTEALFS